MSRFPTLAEVTALLHEERLNRLKAPFISPLQSVSSTLQFIKFQDFGDSVKEAAILGHGRFKLKNRQFTNHWS